jgi:hypothetical protein
MPGAQCTRSRACSVENTRVSHHRSTGITRHSLRDGFNGFFRALPGDRALLPPSPAKVAFRKLDASVEASGPHDFAVRFSAVRQTAHQRPPHPLPALMTLRNAPLWPETARVSATDLPDVASGIFFAGGLDGQMTDLPVGQKKHR